MLFFEKHNQFVQADVRSARCVTPTTAQYLTYKHEAALPSSIVNGATVLDLGSCYGATGHWVLSNGGQHYTGVEAQKEFAAQSEQLLQASWEQHLYRIHNTDITTFIQKCIQQQQKYDVVVLMGVLYAFIDPYALLRMIANVATEYIVIDSLYPWRNAHAKDAVVEIVPNMRLSSTNKHEAYKGVGSRVSPPALDLFLPEFTGSIVVPKKQTDVEIDPFHTLISRQQDNVLPTPKRFLYVMQRNELPLNHVMMDVASSLTTRDQSSVEIIPIIQPPPVPTGQKWKFDSAVAQRFQQEAHQHIPDYDRVLNMCVQIVQHTFPQNFDIKIIDVGSALGYTVQKFIELGYEHTFGVDNSQDMIDNSAVRSHIFNSDKLPEGKWDVVLINWTLHFIQEKSEYLNEVYQQMEDGGLLVLTDKMEPTPLTDYLYMQFKKDNGLTMDQIETKRQSLEGVLLTLPVEWYISKLKRIGFKQVQIVNTRFMFNTITAIK